jgi:hypothetical protein
VVHANLATQFFSLESLMSKDVSQQDLCLVKKELWHRMHYTRKIENIVILTD